MVTGLAESDFVDAVVADFPQRCFGESHQEWRVGGDDDLRLLGPSDIVQQLERFKLGAGRRGACFTAGGCLRISRIGSGIPG